MKFFSLRETYSIFEFLKDAGYFIVFFFNSPWPLVVTRSFFILCLLGYLSFSMFVEARAPAQMKNDADLKFGTHNRRDHNWIWVFSFFFEKISQWPARLRKLAHHRYFSISLRLPCFFSFEKVTRSTKFSKNCSESWISTYILDCLVFNFPFLFITQQIGIYRYLVLVKHTA